MWVACSIVSPLYTTKLPTTLASLIISPKFRSLSGDDYSNLSLDAENAEIDEGSYVLDARPTAPKHLDAPHPRGQLAA